MRIKNQLNQQQKNVLSCKRRMQYAKTGNDGYLCQLNSIVKFIGWLMSTGPYHDEESPHQFVLNNFN